MNLFMKNLPKLFIFYIRQKNIPLSINKNDFKTPLRYELQSIER